MGEARPTNISLGPMDWGSGQELPNVGSWDGTPAVDISCFYLGYWLIHCHQSGFPQSEPFLGGHKTSLGAPPCVSCVCLNMAWKIPIPHAIPRAQLKKTATKAALSISGSSVLGDFSFTHVEWFVRYFHLFVLQMFPPQRRWFNNVLRSENVKTTYKEIQLSIITPRITKTINIWLVVSTPLKNISQWEGLSHIFWKNRSHVPNHQPALTIKTRLPSSKST